MQLSVRVHNVVETGLASLGIWCVMLTKQKKRILSSKYFYEVDRF